MTVHVWAAGDRLLAGDLNDSFADPSNAEGTFTPTVVGSTAAGVGTYTGQDGRYYRIGQLVFVELRVAWTAHTGTGNLLIGGLPFTITTPNATANRSPILAVFHSGLAAAAIAAGIRDTAQLELRDPASGANHAMDPAATVVITGVYRTAAP